MSTEKPQAKQGELPDIQAELNRINAGKVKVSLDDDFDPDVGTLLKVELESAYWHLYPTEFKNLIEQLSDAAGPDAVKQKIEHDAVHLWHGPSPEPTRSTSP